MVESLIWVTMMAESVRSRLCCHVGWSWKTFRTIWPQYAILLAVNINSEVAFGQ
jgi:hypothetical protein